MVWKFVKNAEEMVKGMDEDDCLKLLRLRTKAHELCIVPGKGFYDFHSPFAYGGWDVSVNEGGKEKRREG